MLVGVFGYSMRRAVPLNLAVSLFTVVSAAITRLVLGNSAPWSEIPLVLPVVLALMGGAMLGAWLGARWAGSLSEKRLHLFVCVLLAAIGALLLVEGFTKFEARALVTAALPTAIVGLSAGVGIGIVSSLLGVAGGELIIPTLILIFGFQVKLAGTASLLISLPAMLIGLVRHRRNAAFADRGDVTALILPMGPGSVLGAMLGGYAVALVSQSAVKLLLGVILLASAAKMFFKTRKPSL